MHASKCTLSSIQTKIARQPEIPKTLISQQPVYRFADTPSLEVSAAIHYVASTVIRRREIAHTSTPSRLSAPR